MCDGYLALRNGWQTEHTFWSHIGTNDGRPISKAAQDNTIQLLEAQYFGQWMYTSSDFFFEDLDRIDRIEPRNDVAFARRAISLVWQATGIDLQTDFLRDLAEAHNWRNGLSGADISHLSPHNCCRAPQT